MKNWTCQVFVPRSSIVTCILQFLNREAKKKTKHLHRQQRSMVPALFIITFIANARYISSGLEQSAEGENAAAPRARHPSSYSTSLSRRFFSFSNIDRFVASRSSQNSVREIRMRDARARYAARLPSRRIPRGTLPLAHPPGAFTARQSQPFPPVFTPSAFSLPVPYHRHPLCHPLCLAPSFERPRRSTSFLSFSRSPLPSYTPPSASLFPRRRSIDCRFTVWNLNCRI